MRPSISLGIAALVATVSAIPTISVKGSKFFTSEGSQYFIKGVAYQVSCLATSLYCPTIANVAFLQLVPDDPLIDANQCKLDSALMKTLGANAIRVYHVDPTGDHTQCMSPFADAGIYLWVDLDTFTTQINPVRRKIETFTTVWSWID